MGRRRYHVGLMSGTSVDGIDAALLDFENDDNPLVATHTQYMPGALRERLVALSRGERESVHELCSLDAEVGEAFAAAVVAMLSEHSVDVDAVHAIGSHGQTVRHHPVNESGPRYTLQIGDPNIIAERTGIRTVADFRRRDMAAGGEGAPLVPPFHAQMFGAPGERRAVVNIGGIANATLLRGKAVVAGFDCGPGNTLLDAWIHRERGEPFDGHGAWAAEHAVDEALLQTLLEDAFFARSGPRSTGPEHFNLRWLEGALDGTTSAGDVQATLSELTAAAIVASLPEDDTAPGAVFVCGGGARNTDLMRRLHRHCEARGLRLGTTDELGIAAEWVEASAFAWLAMRTLEGLAGNAPVVTGASGERVLGAVYAAT